MFCFKKESTNSGSESARERTRRPCEAKGDVCLCVFVVQQLFLSDPLIGFQQEARIISDRITITQGKWVMKPSASSIRIRSRPSGGILAFGEVQQLCSKTM